MTSSLKNQAGWFSKWTVRVTVTVFGIQNSNSHMNLILLHGLYMTIERQGWNRHIWNGYGDCYTVYMFTLQKPAWSWEQVYDSCHICYKTIINYSFGVFWPAELSIHNIWMLLSSHDSPFCPPTTSINIKPQRTPLPSTPTLILTTR